MKKRILSILLMIMMVSSVAYASNVDVRVLENEFNPDTYEYSFRIEYSGINVEEGDSFTIQTPIPTHIEEYDSQGNQLIEVTDLGDNNYKITVVQALQELKGYIAGKREVYTTDELKPVIVDGEVILDSFPEIDIPTTPEYPSEPSEAIYKGGRASGNIIDWFININANGTGLQGFTLTDDIGDGHELIEDSITIYNASTGEATDKVKIIDTGAGGFTLEVEDLTTEVIAIQYQTKITDKTQTVFSNQIMAGDRQKVSEEVIVEHDSGVEGSEPDLPSLLPQVGESILKWEYITAILLLAGAVIIKKN